MWHRLFDGIQEIHTDPEEGRNEATLSFSHGLPFLGQTLVSKKTWLFVKRDHGTKQVCSGHPTFARFRYDESYDT